jgi:hypothetical protein
MSIALFKPLDSVVDFDPSTMSIVWGSLVQIVVEGEDGVPADWFTSAAEALDAAELAKIEKENAALQAQIADEQAKLDGRTKAARDLKAKQGDAQ